MFWRCLANRWRFKRCLTSYCDVLCDCWHLPVYVWRFVWFWRHYAYLICDVFCDWWRRLANSWRFNWYLTSFCKKMTLNGFDVVLHKNWQMLRLLTSFHKTVTLFVNVANMWRYVRFLTYSCTTFSCTYDTLGDSFNVVLANMWRYVYFLTSSLFCIHVTPCSNS